MGGENSGYYKLKTEYCNDLPDFYENEYYQNGYCSYDIHYTNSDILSFRNKAKEPIVYSQKLSPARSKKLFFDFITAFGVMQTMSDAEECFESVRMVRRPSDTPLTWNVLE